MPSRFEGKYSFVSFSTGKVGAAKAVFWKNHPRSRSGIFPKNLACGDTSLPCPSNREQQEAPITKIDMKANNIIPQNGKQWVKAIAISIVAVIGFSYLMSHGISPVWTAVLIVVFPGFFRFIYRIACFLVALAILIGILSFLIF